MFDKKQTLRFIQDFSVPKERVFSFFSDHHRLSEIFPGAFKRIVDSTDPFNANGIGSVRRVINFPLIFEDTITKYDEPNLIAYEVTYGSPVKNHKATMHFYDLDNGARSRLDYQIEFEGKIPFSSYWIKIFVQSVIGESIRDLADRFDKDPNY